MIVCPACGHTSPDGSAHCVNCGEPLGSETGDVSGAGHPKTRNFGDQDVKNLVARIEREAAEEESAGNLLAGLPRPKVGSMVSPLRGGQTGASRLPDKRARSASGSTVMGMPIYTTGEQGLVAPPARAMPAPAAPSIASLGSSGPSTIDSLASIQSLDSFQDDFTGASQPPGAVEPAATTPAPLTAAARDDASAADRAPTVGDAALDEPARADSDRRPAVEPMVPDALPDLSAPPDAGDAPSLPGRATFNEFGPPNEGQQSGNGGTLAMVVLILAGLGALAFFLFR